VTSSVPSSLSSLLPGARALASRVVALASLVVVLGVAGCYNPTIKGTFRCNPDYAAPDDCPKGYHCGPDNKCVKGPNVDGGVDKPTVKPPVDAPMDVPVDKTAPIDTGSEVACLAPVPSCTADTTKMCDPVCQSGCAGCQEKCSVNSKGALTCNVAGTGRTRGPFEFCDITSDTSAVQTDNCAPGSVCRTDGCVQPRCYQFCKTNADCPMSACTTDVGSGAKVCDVNYVDCNPLKNGLPDRCGTDTDTLACYLSPGVGDRTFCDCPYMPQRVNATCVVARDCYPGLVCAGAVCHQACGLVNGVSTDCANCVPLNGSTKFGYCN
jgi:hypothetical protein